MVSLTPGMDQARDDFFAHAALPGDEHLGVGPRRTRDVSLDGLMSLAGADHLLSRERWILFVARFHQ